MIRGIHGLFFSSDPEATRAYLRDKLKLPSTDTGGGWLIFAVPVGEVGVHPTDTGGHPTGTHDISFYCDDIRRTVAELRSRGVVFDDEVAEHSYGFVTHFTMPGSVTVELYEPKYRLPPATRSHRPRRTPRRASRRTAPTPPRRR